VLLLWIAVQITPVQNWLVGIATKKLSKELQTEVSIKHVSFSFFNKANLEGTFIQDKKKDTLLYAGKLRVSITDWFFLKDKAELKYIGLEDAIIKINRKDSVWNYQFIADYFSSPKKTEKKGGLAISIKKIDLKDIRFVQNDLWSGEKLECNLSSLSLDADDINFDNNTISLNTLEIDRPFVSIKDFDGLKPMMPKNKTLIDTGLQLNPSRMRLLVKHLKISNGIFIDDTDNDKPTEYFDGAHLNITKINATCKNIDLRNDTLTAAINIACKDRCGIEIKTLTANFKVTPQIMEFAKLDLQTNKSRLGNYYAMKYKHFNKDFGDYVTNVVMKANFQPSTIHSDDIAYFAPELKSWGKKAIIAGSFDGTVSNFTTKNFFLKTQASSIYGNLSMKGLPDIDKTIINLNNGNIITNFQDLCIIAPDLKGMKNPNLAALGSINYKGNFNGYYNNFSTKGFINSALGTVSTDLKLIFPTNAEATYSGIVGSEKFNLGRFINAESIGNINFDGKITGYSFNPDKLKTAFEGKINEFDFNGYNYTNIITSGTFENKTFTGNLKINDPNVDLTSSMQIDFSGDQPRYNLFGDLVNFNFKNTNFTKDNLELTGTLDVNFSGNNIDNFLGEAKLLNAIVRNNGDEIKFDSLNLVSSFANNIKKLKISGSDFMASISGEFNILDLPNSLQSFLHKYYPSYVAAPSSTPKNQDFSFKLNTNYIDPYLKLFDKKLSGLNDASIDGSINTKQNQFQILLQVPYLKYDTYSFTGIDLKGNGNLDSLAMIGSITSTQLNDSFYLPTSKINITSSNDHSIVSIKTKANNTLNDASLLADVYTLDDGIRLQFRPSSFVINEKKWNIETDGELVIRKSYVSAKKLKLIQGFQEINIATENEEDNNSSNLIMQLNNVVLGDFTSMFFKDPKLEGITSGKIILKDFFGNFEAESDLKVEQFRLDQDSIGRIDLNAGFAKKTGIVSWDLNSNNKDFNFTNKGSYNIKDSAKDSPLYTESKLVNVKLSVIEKYLSSIFSHIDGYGKGMLKISGNPDNLNFLGDVKIHDAGMMVNYTQVYYYIDTATIKFEEDGINCGTINIKDKYNNKGIVKGKLYERGFKDMVFDFDLSTKKLLLIDTKAKDNEQFYGKAIGKATLNFKGPESNAKLVIVGEANDTSHIYLPTNTSKESGDADFIVFKQFGQEIVQQKSESKFNLSVDLDLTANNKVDIDVILDEAEGDVIKATGNGRLRIKAGTNEKLDIRGRYNIEKGLYDFNFQSIIQRPFLLLPQSGNFIEWSGDPFKADLHIDAQYEAENISLADLLNNANFGSNDNSLKAQRGPVYIIAQLREKLNQPTIKFKIDFPQNSPAKTDPSFRQFLSRIEKDDNEMLTQATSLIVFGTFTPYGQGLIGGGAASSINYSSLGINTISQKITSEINKQVSNVLFKLFKDKNLKFDLGSSVYSSSNLFNTNLSATSNNKLDRTRVNFKIGRSFLNNKLLVTFGGDLDFNVGNTAAQSGNLQWLPDLNIEYIISQSNNSKLLGIAFSKNSLDISGFTLGSRNRKGVSISYRTESNSFPIFGKKDK
jgi:hypothetical protein